MLNRIASLRIKMHNYDDRLAGNDAKQKTKSKQGDIVTY